VDHKPEQPTRPQETKDSHILTLADRRASMKLPLEERRGCLAEQADRMVDHYNRLFITLCGSSRRDALLGAQASCLLLCLQPLRVQNFSASIIASPF